MREEGGERRGGGALAVLGRLSQFPGRWLRAGCGDAGVGRAAGSQGAARGQPRQPARAPLGPSVLPNRVTGHRMCQVSDCIPGRWVTAACPRARWRGTSRRRRGSQAGAESQRGRAPGDCHGGRRRECLSLPRTYNPGAACQAPGGVLGGHLAWPRMGRWVGGPRACLPRDPSLLPVTVGFPTQWTEDSEVPVGRVGANSFSC